MQKFIPPFLFLLCLVVMLCLHYLYPIQSFILPPLTNFGIPIILLGLGLTVWVRKIFDKIDTEIHTFKTPRKLVIEGPFKFSRNPIYLGFTIALVGIGVFLGTISPFLIVIIFVAITNFWYIPYEEQMMERTFGTAYLIYKKKTRRWL